MADTENPGITEFSTEEVPQETENSEKVEVKTGDETTETSAKAKESGIRRRIKISIPGIINSDESSKKPPSAGWTQQRLPACRPVYTGFHIFIVFLIFGVVFLVVGAVLLAFNLQLNEYSVPYTECSSKFPNEAEAISMQCRLIGNETTFPTCAEYVINISQYDKYTRQSLCPCYCQVTLSVESNMSLPIYVFYKLTNYYQNHRRYISSWSPRSLIGEDIQETRSECDPLVEDANTSSPYFPCGLIANSFFNDTLMLRGVNISSKDIAWKTDRDTRFKNPPDRNDTELPPNWLDYIDNGQRNESYMVWFRVAAFPNFRKLLGRVVLPPGENVLEAGNYTLDIVYNYPVTMFQGGKSFVLAEANEGLGTRNLFLGISYLATGGLCVAVGLFMLIVRLICSKWKTTDKNFLNRGY